MMTAVTAIHQARSASARASVAQASIVRAVRWIRFRLLVMVPTCAVAGDVFFMPAVGRFRTPDRT